MSLSAKADKAAAESLGISVDELRERWGDRAVTKKLPATGLVTVNGKPHPTKATGRIVRADPSPKRRQDVIDRDGPWCRYCGRKVSETSDGNARLTLDHLTPKSRGGTNHASNLVVACSPCNHQKGDRTLDEYGVPLRRPQQGPREADTTDCPDCTGGVWKRSDGRECPTCDGTGELSAGRAVRLFLDARARVYQVSLDRGRIREQVRALTEQLEDRDGIGSTRKNLAATVQTMAATIAQMNDAILRYKVQIADLGGGDLDRLLPRPHERERALRLVRGESDA